VLPAQAAQVIRAFFVKSSGILLLLTAIAKLSAFYSKTPISGLHDPILGFQFRDEFLVLGLVEFGIAILCLLTRYVRLQLGLLAWLATSFAVYRVGIALIGIIIPCPCLGNFAQVFHLSIGTANAITFAMLIYLLAGSYYWLFNASIQKTR
jgi:hypothetical protein